MVWIVTMLAALIGLMFFGTMASAFTEMRREEEDRNELPIPHRLL